MSDHILTMFRWNIWANERYRNVLSTIDFDRLSVDTPYGILLDRIVHIFASFEMWIARMMGGSPQSVLRGSEMRSWDELSLRWREAEKKLLEFTESLGADEIRREISYVSLNGETYTRTVESILLHLTAHPNYHRGQLSTIFKYLELPALPPTDMVIYFLET